LGKWHRQDSRSKSRCILSDRCKHVMLLIDSQYEEKGAGFTICSFFFS
jgi:hypothetical protein